MLWKKFQRLKYWSINMTQRKKENSMLSGWNRKVLCVAGKLRKAMARYGISKEKVFGMDTSRKGIKLLFAHKVRQKEVITMPLKRSAYVGETLGRLIEEEGASRDQLAFDFSVSKPTITSIKANKRTMPSDVAKESIRLYDNPEYIMDILHEFSSGFTSPVMRGRQVEHHRLALRHTVAREMRNVLNMMEEAGLEKNIESLSTVERERIADLMDALLNSRLHSDNLLKQMQVEYRISMKERLKVLGMKWKALGWI